MDVTFHMLALDVLSGRPEPQGSAPQLLEAYEVWGYRHHPSAVAIIRFFDGGASIACAAFVPQELAGDERFAAAVGRLVELRVPGASAASPAGRLSDLELLDTVAAFERLARALALHRDQKGLEARPLLTGTPSDGTLGYLETLEMLDPFAPGAEGESRQFEDLADTLLDEPDRFRWSGARERAHEERIEVLVHVANPAATVLIHFRPMPEVPLVSAYLPTLEDDATHARIVEDVRALVSLRALGIAVPVPLPANGQFRRLGLDRALVQLEAILTDLERGDGCVHDFPAGPEGNPPDSLPELPGLPARRPKNLH